jgi:hypothetical protein
MHAGGLGCIQKGNAHLLNPHTKRQKHAHTGEEKQLPNNNNNNKSLLRN